MADGRRPAPVVTFLSDYGTADEFVGVVHSVVLSICPSARLVDLTHHVPAHDVRAGADALVRAAPYLVPGVVLAVVDPGVGGPRRRLVLECGPHQLVGPDNGLLVPLADELGGIEAAYEADRPEYWWDGGRVTARTFDGRDVFGPVAAHLASGVEARAMGRRVDPDGLVRLPEAELERGPGARIGCVVAHVDGFGNVGLAVAAAGIPRSDQAASSLLSIRLPTGALVTARRVDVFSDLDDGELGLLVDSSGHPALVFDRAPAAERLALRPGDRIEIEVVEAEHR